MTLADVARLSVAACVLVVAQPLRAQEDPDAVQHTPPPTPDEQEKARDTVDAAGAEAQAETNANAGKPDEGDKEDEKPTAGWDPDVGFVIRSANSDYLLRVGFQGGYRYQPTLVNGDWADRTAFFVLRPIISGNLYKPWIRFWTSLELAANPIALLDSYVDVQPWTEFGLRAGQQYTPFSRHESYGPQQILFPDFNTVANYFWSGRDKGVTAFGNLWKTVDYYLGLYGGSPLGQLTTFAGNWVAEGRVTVSPMGPVAATEFPYITNDESYAPFGVSFTLQGYYGKVRSAQENFNPGTFSLEAVPVGPRVESGTAGADFFMQGSHFAFLAEGYFRRTNPEDDALTYDALGAWAQLGVMLIKNRLDIAGQVMWTDPSNELDHDRFIAAQAQVAYYVNAPHVVLKLRYGVGDQDSPGDAALGNVQLPVVGGRSQIGTLQINVAF